MYLISNNFQILLLRYIMVLSILSYNNINNSMYLSYISYN